MFSCDAKEGPTATGNCKLLDSVGAEVIDLLYQVAVCLLHKPHGRTAKKEFLLVQRPSTGLLASMWEFPTVSVEEKSSSDGHLSALNTFLQTLGLEHTFRFTEHLGNVTHLFSHIRQEMVVYGGQISATKIKKESSPRANKQAEIAERDIFERSTRWVAEGDALAQCAISTGQKKCFKLLGNSRKGTRTDTRKRKRGVPIRQSTLTRYVKPKCEP